MIDADLANLYGVKTKRLNEQVKRNQKRFPEDFMFQLTPAEKEQVVAKCDHLRTLKFAYTMPYVFTEHGAIMLASILNTPAAIEMNVYVVRAFVQLREVFMAHRTLALKLTELENKMGHHDEQIQELFEAIRHLMKPPQKSTRKIGFN